MFIKSVQRYDNFLGIAKEMFKELKSEEICQKKRDFLNIEKTKKAVQPTLITTFGLTQGGYSYDIQNQVTMEDLFRNATE